MPVEDIISLFSQLSVLYEKIGSIERPYDLVSLTHAKYGSTIIEA